MTNQIKTTLFLFVLCSILTVGCDKDEDECSETHVFNNATVAEKLSDIELCAPCDAITLAGGSTDALAGAVSRICEDGIIYLEAGVHTENSPITISKSIKLIGEPGAILKLPGEPKPLEFPEGTDGNFIIQAGLHFLNSSASLIQDIEIQPVQAEGNTAILLENSNNSGVINCTITDFQFGILVEKSDDVVLMLNTIKTMGRWLDDPNYTDAHAITIINGKNVYIADNDVSNSVFGIWGCDENGIMERNTARDNFVGYILCNVPQNYMTLPQGNLTGALQPANGYVVQNNSVSDSFGEGYLVIDGAHNNRLENNSAINSGTYDMELTTLTLRFGIPAPEAYNNTVVVGNNPDFRIKDCGTNNTITGGVLVDTGTDECN